MGKFDYLKNTAINNSGEKNTLSQYRKDTILELAKEEKPQFFDKNGNLNNPENWEKIVKWARKYLRVLLFSNLQAIKTANEKNNKNLLLDNVKAFVQFYKDFYKVNDFSVKSVFTGNDTAKVQYVANIMPLIEKTAQNNGLLETPKKVAKKAPKKEKTQNNVTPEKTEKTAPNNA